jgi:catechol 2,3-dioxygenase-like lactoylglutathione lyase family enzyme
VPDVFKAVAWYKQVFGFTVVKAPFRISRNGSQDGEVAAGVLGPNFKDMMIAHMATADGVGFEVFQFIDPDTLSQAKENVEWRAGFFHIALTHPNVAAIVETIVAAGGKQRSDVLYNFKGEDHCICYCEDPYGNVIEIMSTRYEQLFANRS